MPDARGGEQDVAQAEPRVRSGHVTALRLFDLAHKIDLPRAEELWPQRAQGASARSRLVGTPPKAVSFGVPPLALELGPVALTIDAVLLQATASVRLYDFGIAALSLRLPVQDVTWAGFSRLVNQIDHAVGPNAATEVWDTLLTQLRRLLGEALERPTAAPLQEDYLIALVDAFEEPVTAEALQERADLVPLLSGEERPLSEGARRDLLRHRFLLPPGRSGGDHLGPGLHSGAAAGDRCRRRAGDGERPVAGNAGL